MFSHIHSASIPVADQDVALDFYVNTLGWEKAMDQPIQGGGRWLTVVPPGETTQLVLADAADYGVDRPVVRKTGISLIAPDIEAAHATLVARGVTFTEPVMDMPWGARGTWFHDPDGNEFFLVSAL